MANRFASINMSMDFKFCNETIKIRKLTVSQVSAIQTTAREIELAKSDTSADGLARSEKLSMDLLELMIRSGVDEFKDFTSEEFGELPIDELTKLSNQILKYSGLAK